MSAWGAEFDVLVTPTTAILPPPVGYVLEQAHANDVEGMTRLSKAEALALERFARHSLSNASIAM